MKRVSPKFVEMFGLALRGRMIRLTVLALTLFVLFTLHAVAQDATVVGTVTDPTGAALPNVSVPFHKHGDRSYHQGRPRVQTVSMWRLIFTSAITPQTSRCQGSGLPRGGAWC